MLEHILYELSISCKLSSSYGGAESSEDDVRCSGFDFEFWHDFVEMKEKIYLENRDFSIKFKYSEVLFFYSASLCSHFLKNSFPSILHFGLRITIFVEF